METKMTEIEINGIKYVPKDSYQPAVSSDGLPYVVIRADRAGVFAGYLKEKKPDEVTLVNVRRLWYWSGVKNGFRCLDKVKNSPRLLSS